MMDLKATADVSAHLLFEATGDSEAEALSDPIMDAIALSDDDAQSCSYDASESRNVSEVINGYVSHDELDDEKKEDEDEEVCVYGTSYCEDDDEIQQHHKSTESVDSGPDLVDEIEKNRRFWEACLAS